eukprot:TRINITY_DN2587_c0_g2_i6.p1 TRINITY_DN2587_c0_g2~~TRINITY_DN2587_c0_g2_i6.p1  ORF type:complete len:109 (-),score=26.64 TRINITY_DN2587_c0_g2_i6:9-335(-)
MIRRPPRSTHCISSAASDVYKRQFLYCSFFSYFLLFHDDHHIFFDFNPDVLEESGRKKCLDRLSHVPVSYTHLRAHETRHDLVCRLLLEKKKKKNQIQQTSRLDVSNE